MATAIALLMPASSSAADPESSPSPSSLAPSLSPRGEPERDSRAEVSGWTAPVEAPLYGPAGPEAPGPEAPGPEIAGPEAAGLLPDEGLTAPGSREVLPVLPLGTGLMFMGLGIAAFGLRLRRA